MTLVKLMMVTPVFVSPRLNVHKREELPQEVVPLLSVSAAYVSKKQIEKRIEKQYLLFSVTVSACGGTVTQNNTYIQSPNYPAPAPVGMCMYTMNKCDSNICQFR